MLIVAVSSGRLCAVRRQTGWLLSRAPGHRETHFTKLKYSVHHETRGTHSLMGIECQAE